MTKSLRFPAPANDYEAVYFYLRPTDADPVDLRLRMGTHPSGSRTSEFAAHTGDGIVHMNVEDRDYGREVTVSYFDAKEKKGYVIDGAMLVEALKSLATTTYGGTD